jgi:predicted SnoaL-like aldol condensation-catalyzing enzyme
MAAPMAALAQVPVTPAVDPAATLASPDPRLAANKRLVFDMWRTLVMAAQVEQAPRFLTEDYIDRLPMVQPGRAGFQAFMGRQPRREAVPPTIPRLVAMVAEGDMVVMSLARELPEPGGPPGVCYTTTWFDMFRIRDGLVAEHWDSTVKGGGFPVPCPKAAP